MRELTIKAKKRRAKAKLSLYTSAFVTSALVYGHLILMAILDRSGDSLNLLMSLWMTSALGLLILYLVEEGAQLYSQYRRDRRINWKGLVNAVKASGDLIVTAMCVTALLPLFFLRGMSLYKAEYDSYKQQNSKS